MKQFIVFILIIVCSVPVFAQGRGKQEDFELYKAKRVSYMTEKLQLTPQEAQKFWPIYNEYDKLRGEYHEKRRELEKKAWENYDKLSEADFKKLNAEVVSLSVKECGLVKTYNDKFLGVLPAKKVILVGPTENEFRFKMIREFRQKERDGNHDSK
ncbi:MAG: hypothetical protein ACK5JD_00380 [Mangrovibacterium sp.]